MKKLFILFYLITMGLFPSIIYAAENKNNFDFNNNFTYQIDSLNSINIIQLDLKDINSVVSVAEPGSLISFTTGLVAFYGLIMKKRK